MGFGGRRRNWAESEIARFYGLMPFANILSDEFAQAAAAIGLRARRDALASGHAVVFLDKLGRYIQELPDGSRQEVHLEPSGSWPFQVLSAIPIRAG